LVRLAATVFSFALASAQTAFDIDLTAVVEETLTNLGEPSEGDDAMLLSALLPLAVVVVEALGRGRRNSLRSGQSHPWCEPGVSSQIADYDHLVDCHCHKPPLVLLRPLPVSAQGVVSKAL
jgi:hypothetical protein